MPGGSSRLDVLHGSKAALEGGSQGGVDLGQGRLTAQAGEACHGFVKPAGHNASKVVKVGRDVEAHAVRADPASQAQANGGDFGELGGQISGALTHTPMRPARRCGATPNSAKTAMIHCSRAAT